MRQELQAVKAQLSRRSIWSNCPVILPRRLWQYLIQQLGVTPETRWADFSKKQLNQLIELLTQS
ncbi:MAG: aminoacetone oxidase family FAD-binding enzyme, partial [Microcoleus sp. SIO2G3]|nr:aminoacetone oxidase family FAD-binding enzyme [Microcoleus sp. SIO2G3]